MATKKAEQAGTITDKDLYTVRELRRRLGLSFLSIFIARLRGLRTHKISGKNLCWAAISFPI